MMSQAFAWICALLWLTIAVHIADAFADDWGKPYAPFASYCCSLRALFAFGVCIFWPVLIAGTGLRICMRGCIIDGWRSGHVRAFVLLLRLDIDACGGLQA
jgi:hypothetical protein